MVPTFMLVSSRKLLKQVVRADAAEEYVIFREPRVRYLRAQGLDVLLCGSNKANRLEMLHRLVIRVQLLHQIDFLLQDL